jgi:hypothetical protein
MSGAILGFLAFALVAQAGVVWMRLIREVRVASAARCAAEIGPAWG